MGAIVANIGTLVTNASVK